MEVFSAQTVMRGLGILTFMVPVGFMFANTALIGYHVGTRDVAAIKHYFRVSMFLAVLIGLIQGVLLHFKRDMIIQFFSTDETV